MARDTDANASLEALEHLLAIQEQHTEILTHLEQREIPDMAGLARRLDDVADAVRRLKTTEVIKRRVRGKLLYVVLFSLVVGFLLSWFTVRWFPSGVLPPGFSRLAPVPQKGRL